MPLEKIDKYDTDGIMNAARPEELAPAYVFTASSRQQLDNGRILHRQIAIS